jgi:hypothetical protein
MFMPYDTVLSIASHAVILPPNAEQRALGIEALVSFKDMRGQPMGHGYAVSQEQADALVHNNVIRTKDVTYQDGTGGRVYWVCLF